MPIASPIPDSAAPSPSLLRLHRTWIVADDLTGACDAGAAFLRAGLTVRVWTGAQPGFRAPEAVQAINTASRDLENAKAAHAVGNAAAALRNDDRTMFFKKVDSTLRGPIAAELKAAQEAFAARAVLFAPAFPAAGRTVCDGILNVEDISGRRDAILIRDLFPANVWDDIAYVASADELAPALQRGKTVLVCDSSTQADLDGLARAAQSLEGLLYAGSAGLAQAIAGLYACTATLPQIPKAARTLVVCGSAHPVTRLQMEELDRQRFPAVGMLQICCQSGDEERIRAAFEDLRPQALVLTGGDTALLALRALGVDSLLLAGECAPGVPWGTAANGIANGATVVTKSGGFGAASTLNDVLAMLAGRS